MRIIKEIQICSRCVSDTTMSEIQFDEKGVCNFCKLHDIFEENYPVNEIEGEKLDRLVKEIKRKGEGKPYDCIVGVSGGADSSFLLYWLKEKNLRPLAVTFDNGWCSDIAVKNIKNVTQKLNIDLHTVVADWEEMKDIQRSFLKASVSDADAPTDYAIYSTLFFEAYKNKIKYVFNGHSFRNEGSVPKSWSYFDSRYIRNVHKLYGSVRLKSFPIMRLSQFVFYMVFKRIKDVRVLESIDYNKNHIKKLLSEKFGWIDYGGHHHENIFTRFFQSYYLPVKFGIDKRKVELSAMVRSGFIPRENALEILETDYAFNQNDVNYVLKKLEFTPEEWNEIMKTSRKMFMNFKTNYPLIKMARLPLKIAAGLNLIPKILYEKYAKM